MPGRFTDSQVVYQKCLDAECSNTIRRTPHEVKDGTHVYCCTACRVKNIRPHRYTPELVERILALPDGLSLVDIALKLDISYGGFKKWVCVMKKADPSFKLSLPERKKKYKEKEKPLPPVKEPAPPKKGRGQYIKPRTEMVALKPYTGSRATWKDKKLPTRKPVEGGIKIVFRDKHRTTFVARDEEHLGRIVERYGHLGDYVTSLISSD